MPHKRNPVVCERVSGLARVVRGHAVTALENVALWHERDISHSSAERLILPDATGLLAFMLRDMTWVIDGLVVFPERMRELVDSRGGIAFSQTVLLALVEAGMARDEAYRIVQRAAAAAWDEGASFHDEIAKDPAVTERLDAAGGRRAVRPGAVPRQPRSGLRPTRSAGGRPARDARRAGQGPRHLRGGRRALAAGRDRPDQRVRRDPADADPRQGARADRLLAVLVRADRRPRPEPRGHGRPSACSRRRSTPTPSWPGRATLVRAAEVVPMECVVRGYLRGSGWSQYRAGGAVCGIPLPDGLEESPKLPEPIFTPTTKAPRATTCRSRPPRRGSWSATDSTSGFAR